MFSSSIKLALAVELFIVSFKLVAPGVIWRILPGVSVYLKESFILSSCKEVIFLLMKSIAPETLYFFFFYCFAWKLSESVSSLVEYLPLRLPSPIWLEDPYRPLLGRWHLFRSTNEPPPLYLFLNFFSPLLPPLSPFTNSLYGLIGSELVPALSPNLKRWGLFRFSKLV